MNDISEFRQEGSVYELLAHLYDKIASGELASFRELKAYASPVPKGQRLAAILKKCFELQRRLRWGFFSPLGPEAYPALWKRMVIPDKDYPFAGDLRRYATISDAFLCMIDIHGYTRYCRDHRHNPSMLDLLDRMLQEDVPRLVASSGVLSRRARGDELLLLGASACDVLDATLKVIAYLSSRRRLGTGPTGGPEGAPILPDFQVSVGIAGGQMYSSLVITRDGDLSGDIVNAAARLQARANKISPDHTKILVTTHVYQHLKGAGPALQAVQGINGIDFFNAGPVEFKGVALTVYDVVFLKSEPGRLAYRDAMEGLYEALDKDLWKSAVFEQALALASRLVDALEGEPQDAERRQALKALVKAAADAFSASRYEFACATLGRIVAGLREREGVDALALDYLGQVNVAYGLIVDAFAASVDAELEAHLDAALSPREIENYQLLRKHHGLYEELRDRARLKIRGRKALWFKEADKALEYLDIRIRSGK